MNAQSSKSVVSEGWDESSAKEVWSDKSVLWSIDWVTSYSDGSMEKMTFSQSEDRRMTVLTDWNMLYDWGTTRVYSDLKTQIVSSELQSKSNNGAVFSWSREKREITDKVSYETFELNSDFMKDIYEKNAVKENKWEALDPFDCKVSYKGKDYSFGKKQVTFTRKESIYKYKRNSSYDYIIADILTYTVGDHTMDVPAIISYEKEPKDHTTFLPRDWGWLYNVQQTVVNNPKHNGFRYIWSIHFSNGGIMPIIITPGSGTPDWHFEYHENTTCEEYNSAYYSSDGKWYNAIASDDVDMMRWREAGPLLATLKYDKAYELNWDEGRGTSVNTCRYTIEIKDGGLSVTDSYTSKESWYSPSFKKEWGKLLYVNQSLANNETNDGYVYVWSLHFANCYVLPVIVTPGSTSPLWNLNYAENTAFEKYNSAVYKDDKWLNAMAYDGLSEMRWSREGTIVDSKEYEAASNVNWDEGNGISVYTNRYAIEYPNIGRFTSTDSNTGVYMGSWDGLHRSWVDQEYVDENRAPQIWEASLNVGKYGKVIYNGEEIRDGCKVVSTEERKLPDWQFQIFPDEGYAVDSVGLDGVDITKYLIDSVLKLKSVRRTFTMEVRFVKVVTEQTHIYFKDPAVKSICVSKWDSDKNGELSKDEAAAVISLGDAFTFNDEITSFDELQYFTGLKKLNDNEFTRCISLTSLTIPASVTSIVGSALGGCSSLKSFKLAEGNNSFIIDNGVLYNKVKTKLICCPAGKTGSLSLPESVIEIGANSFYNCALLTSVSLPSSVQKIGDGAFVGCSGLTSFNIPASLGQYYLGLGEGAFVECTNLTEFTVEAANTNYQAVDGVLFELNNNTPITLVAYPNKKSDKYTIPEMTAIIRDYAFCKTDIKELVFPNMLLSIGDNAFGYCPKLEKVTTNMQIPSITTLVSAFSNSTGTAKLYVPKGTKPLYLALEGWNSFGSDNIMESSGEGSPMFFVDDASGNFYQVLDDGESVALIWNQSPSSPTSFTIPSSVTFGGTTYTVTTVGSEENVVFDNYKMPIFGDRYSKLASLEIPNTVKKFRDYAFYRCPLTSLVIPNSVEEIGAWAFQCYDKMNSLTLGTGLKTIGRRAFAGCAAQTLTIPEGVTSIGAEAFIYSMSLKTLTLPSTLKSIGSYAFSSCINLETIYNYARNPAVLVNTDNDANYKPWLAFASIDLDVCALWVPKGCESKYKDAEGWKNFGNIQEMEGADTEIITFADANVKAICVENWDTDGDSELSMDEAVAVTSIGTLFKNNDQITSFDELQYFTGLTTIEESAFEDCNNLTSISIPSNVTSIGDRAFFDCSNLKSVVSYIMEPFNIMPNVFRKMEYTPLSGGTWEEEYVSSSATLYVPIGTLEKYKALSGISYLNISGPSYYSNGWTMFARMVEKKLGDANGDRSIDDEDVRTVADYILNKNTEGCYELNADLNNDKTVNVADIVELNDLLKEQ